MKSSVKIEFLVKLVDIHGKFTYLSLWSFLFNNFWIFWAEFSELNPENFENMIPIGQPIWSTFLSGLEALDH